MLALVALVIAMMVKPIFPFVYLHFCVCISEASLENALCYSLFVVIVLMVKPHWRMVSDIPNYCWDYSHSLNTCIHTNNVCFANNVNYKTEN